MFFSTGSLLFYRIGNQRFIEEEVPCFIGVGV